MPCVKLQLAKNPAGKGRQAISEFMNPTAVKTNASKDKPKLSNPDPRNFSPENFQDATDFIDFALDAALKIINAHAGSFFLWDEFKKELVAIAVRGPYQDRVRKAHVKLREGILGIAADQGSPVWVKDIEDDRRFRLLKTDRLYRSDSFVLLPLIVHNRLLGVLTLTEKENLLPFSEEDFVRSQLFAQLIATAYENLRVATRLRNENDQLHQTVARVREAHQDSEFLVSMGKLAAHLVHELNNPLDAIRRYVNLALNQASEDSLTREYLLKTKEAVRRTLQVIQGLLQFSRESRSSAARKMELHELLDETLKAIIQDPAFQAIKITKKYCPLPIFIHDQGLAVVLRNLYQNAHHAMKGAGVLTVTTEIQNGSARIVVEDTGCGIGETVKSHLFEPFFTTKTDGEGLGIGLTLCYEIIQRSGGQISCENVAGKGARFTLTLPYESLG